MTEIKGDRVEYVFSEVRKMDDKSTFMGRDVIKLVKKDIDTGQILAEWSPLGTKIKDFIQTTGNLIVIEDLSGFPQGKSNVYALDKDLKLLWTAEQAQPGDAYTCLSGEKGNSVVVSGMKYKYELDPVTGWITVKEKIQQEIELLDSQLWKRFFSLTGGSILYCLSAFFVLYGIVNIMAPVLATSEAFRECLPCIGAMNLYEIALLGVLLLIVIWQNVTDDAISLVVLISLYLIANAIALDTLAPRNPKIVLYLGLACVVLALIKLVLLKRFILYRLGKGTLAAGVIILAWNFTVGPIFGIQKLGLPVTTATRRESWLIAWLIILAAAVMVLVEMALTPARKNGDKNREPFLRTSAMSQLFLLLVIAAVGIHQYALTYLFYLQCTLGDFIPLIGICSLLLIEVLRNAGKRFGVTEVVIACAPLVVTLWGIGYKAVTASASVGLELLWYPPVMLGLIGAGVLWLSFLNRRPWLWCVAGAYALGVILTIGYTSGRPYEVNWHLAGIVVVVVLLALGVWFRNPYPCFAAVLAAAIGLGITADFKNVMDTLHVHVAGGAFGFAGLATLLIYLVFTQKFSRELAFIAALGLMIFLFDFAPREMGWEDILSAVGVIALVAILWARTKNVAPIVPLCIPLGWRGGVLIWNMSKWGYVLLGFLILAAGACVSLHKGRKRLFASSENREPGK